MRFQKSRRGSKLAPHGFPFEIHKKCGVGDHGISGGRSNAFSASISTQSRSLRMGPESLRISKNSRPVTPSNAIGNRLTTSENDSRGLRFALRSRSYASNSNVIVFVGIP